MRAKVARERSEYEKDFWTDLRLKIRDCHWQRIESGMTSRGIPDVNACRDGVECWLELKVVQGRQVKLRPEQVAWLLLRTTRFHGRAWIVANDYYRERILVWSGRYADKVKQHGIDAPVPVNIFPKPVNWEALANLLFG